MLELLGDILTREPVEDAHAVNLELEEVRFRLGLADRRIDLRPEDVRLVDVVRLPDLNGGCGCGEPGAAVFGLQGGAAG